MPVRYEKNEKNNFLVGREKVAKSLEIGLALMACGRGRRMLFTDKVHARIAFLQVLVLIFVKRATSSLWNCWSRSWSWSVVRCVREATTFKRLDDRPLESRKVISRCQLDSLFDQRCLQCLCQFLEAFPSLPCFIDHGLKELRAEISSINMKVFMVQRLVFSWFFL